MSFPNSNRSRAVDAAAQHLLTSGALDGWLSRPASSVSPPSSRVAHSHGGSPLTSNSRSFSQPGPSTTSSGSSRSNWREDKSPSAFYEHGAFHGVRAPPEDSEEPGSSSPAPVPAPANAPPNSLPVALPVIHSAPAYEDSSHDYTDTSLAPVPNLRHQRSGLALPGRSGGSPAPSGTINHEHLTMRIRRLPEMLDKTSITLRGAKLRPFDVDRPHVDTAGIEHLASNGIQEVVAHGDGIWINISQRKPDGGQGQSMHLHTLPDRLAIASRRIGNEGSPRVIKVLNMHLKDSSGKRPFKNYPQDVWTFLGRVGYHRRSAQTQDFPVSIREIQTNWLLKGAGLPIQGIKVAFVFRTLFEPHSRPGANDQVEIKQFALGKGRGPRVFKEGTSYRRWKARGVEL